MGYTIQLLKLYFWASLSKATQTMRNQIKDTPITHRKGGVSDIETIESEGRLPGMGLVVADTKRCYSNARARTSPSAMRH